MANESLRLSVIMQLSVGNQPASNNVPDASSLADSNCFFVQEYLKRIRRSPIPHNRVAEVTTQQQHGLSNTPQRKLRGVLCLVLATVANLEHCQHMGVFIQPNQSSAIRSASEKRHKPTGDFTKCQTHGRTVEIVEKSWPALCICPDLADVWGLMKFTKRRSKLITYITTDATCVGHISRILWGDQWRILDGEKHWA